MSLILKPGVELPPQPPLLCSSEPCSLLSMSPSPRSVGSTQPRVAGNAAWHKIRNPLNPMGVGCNLIACLWSINFVEGGAKAGPASCLCSRGYTVFRTVAFLEHSL